MKESRPPRIAILLLETFIPAESREAVIGDLIEKYSTSTRNPVITRLGFWRETVAAILKMQLAPDSVSAFTPFLRESTLQSFVGDLRYSWRSLRRAPMFTAIVVFTTAVGIGANATVLGIIDTAFLRKLPVPEPERIVRIASRDATSRSKQADFGWNSFPDWRDLRSHVAGIEDLAAFAIVDVKLGGDLAGLQAQSAFISGNYFDVLRVRPARGRFIARDEEEPAGAHPVVVISDVLWRTAFGEEEAVVGRTLLIGTGTFTIVGVAPPGFKGTHSEGRTDLWMPYTMEEVATGKSNLYANRAARSAQLIGRLRKGASIAEVQSSADNIARDLASRYPATNRVIGFRAAIQDRLVPLAQAPGALVSMLLVWAMIAMLHTVACFNVASLVLARAAARRREIGIRLCLGASRGRIISQSLAESALLALLGAAGALLVGRWLTKLITSMTFMAAMDAGFDIRIVAITIAVAIATVLQIGMLPALTAARSDPIGIVRGTSATISSRTQHRASSRLITGQVAISLILLGQAAVMLGKFRRESAADPGYDPSQVVVAKVSARSSRTTRAEKMALYDDLIRRTAAVPGLTRVTSAGSAPLYGGWMEDVSIPGFVYPPNALRRESLRTVGPDYFATIGAQMVAGREFTPRDRINASDSLGKGMFDVVIVNERMARRYWPGQDPIGKSVVFRKGTATVVGVVRDMRDVVPRTTTPVAYFPLLESISPSFVLIVRVDGDPLKAVARMRNAIALSTVIDPPLVRTLDELRANVFQLSRVLGLALSACAGLALVLTAIGLYGAVAMWAATRRAEIGIRLALGGTAAHVTKVLLSGAGRLTAIGASIGTVLTLVVLQIERASFGPTMQLDAAPVVGAIILFAVVIAAAAFLPARRATRMTPAEVLRTSE